MKSTSQVVIAFVATLISAECLALPSVKDVTRIIVGQGYSKNKAEIIEAEEVRKLAREFDELNTKQWQEASIIKFGGKCMVRVHFINKGQGGFTVYAYPDRLYWSPQGRKNPYKYVAIDAGALPALRKVASSLLLGERCTW